MYVSPKVVFSRLLLFTFVILYSLFLIYSLLSNCRTNVKYFPFCVKSKKYSKFNTHETFAVLIFLFNYFFYSFKLFSRL